MDFGILYWIQDHARNTFLDGVMPPLTILGDFGFIWLMLGLILIIVKKYRVYGIECLAAVALAGAVVNLVIKPLVDRARPFILDSSIALLQSAPMTSSFPSGHTAASFAAAVIICSMPIKLVWKIVAVLIASLVAFSRMYLFFHFPSDVLVGLIVGVCCGLICVFAGRKIKALNKFKSFCAEESASL